MKNAFIRLSALVLALFMLLAVLGGCKNSDDTPDNGESGGNTDCTDTPSENNPNEDSNPSEDEKPDETDKPTVTEPVQIKTTIYEIAKYGNLVLYMYSKDLYDKGFEHGDVVEIAIGDKKWDVPLCTSYSDVDNGETVLRANGETDGVVLAINMGDFATTAGIAQKVAIDEDPGYRWDYLMESPVEITITMKEEGGYREQWLIRQLVRTNERADYANLSDEAFANFRVIETTGIGKGLLYRSSSPINPALGRNTYADEAAKNAGVITVVNLADPSNTYDGTESTYYSTCQVVYVNLGMDFLEESTLRGIAEGMRFIIDNNGPYLIHCNEGKDRAGFVSALLECLMGATLDEVIDDYMLTYYNYYGVEEGSEKYNAVLNNNLIKVLNATFKVEDVYKADLVAEAEAFLIEDAGLTADEVAALKVKLRVSLQEVYEAGKDYAALLGDRDSVYIQATSNGKFLYEEYLSKEYFYSFFDSEYMNMGVDNASFATDHSGYSYYDGDYERYVTLTKNGILDEEEFLSMIGTLTFISSEMLNDENASVIEKDGLIIVTVTADVDELELMGEDIVSCVESYTLDAKTREMIAVKTVYTYADGTVEEGLITITRDTEAPEGARNFIAYEETENLCTVTIVSNPGTDDEKTETVQVAKGLKVAFYPDFGSEDVFTLYADAACTQVVEGNLDVNSDVTVYVKWNE